MRLPSGTFAQSYGQDMALVRTKTHWVFLAVLMVFVFTIPQWASNSFLTTATVIGITIISAHGLNILTGNCGLVSMGHSGFMMVGGYAMAILCSKVGMPFWARCAHLRPDRGRRRHHLRSAFSAGSRAST